MYSLWNMVLQTHQTGLRSVLHRSDHTAGGLFHTRDLSTEVVCVQQVLFARGFYPSYPV